MILNLPNKLTLVRLLLTPVALAVFFVDFKNHMAYSLAIFLVAISTDVLDGYLARSRNLITKFGTFLDPLADKLIILGYLIALLSYDVLPVWLVVIMVLRDLTVDAFRSYCASQNVFLSAIAEGKIKALLQNITIILGHIYLLTSDPLYQLYTLTVMWLAIFIAYAGMVKLMYAGRKIFKASN